jgi:hypothetical protein
MRRYLSAAVVAAIATLATALPADAASAVLTVGSTSGPAVAVGDVLWGDLKSGTSAVFKNTGNSNQIACAKSRFDATVGSNPAPPGTGTFTITAWTFSSCTTNFGATVVSITVDNLPYNGSVIDPGAGPNVTISPGSGGIIHLTIVLTQVFQFTCKYKVHDASGHLFGTTSNADNSLTFSNQQFDKESGAIACFPSFVFSATYVLTDHTQSGGLVFVN